MNHIWLLEKGTPIPEELQVINDDGNHVKIMPDERTPVTVEKFKEVFITISLLKSYYDEKKKTLHNLIVYIANIASFM